MTWINYDIHLRVEECPDGWRCCSNYWNVILTCSFVVSKWEDRVFCWSQQSTAGLKVSRIWDGKKIIKKVRRKPKKNSHWFLTKLSTYEDCSFSQYEIKL
uniref:Uncharacterized protein n=1 Tax=Micrurus corallinus TaxID=54390 RepID=A0A2D4F5B6_MICCO